MKTELMGFDELSHKLGSRRFSFSTENGFSSVSIDSRTVDKGSLFFALNGKSLNGHDYVAAAFNAGAAGAMVEACALDKYDLVNLAKKMGKELIVVENSLKALQDSARVYMEKFDKIKKIGITGSSGKTTTKEITAAIISCEKNTVMSKGNLNSETGLALSIFEVRDNHEVGVFELGMNRPGEMTEITYILKPNIALITNIGTAHIEFIGSKDKIFIEKKSIFKFLSDNDVALIPAADDYAKRLAEGVTGKVKYYGTQCFEELEGIRSLGIEGTEIIYAGEKIHFALPGKHCLDDAMAAIAIAKEIPVSVKAIKQGLETVKPLFGRLEILKGRTTVICDCYNANPESTAKSIEFCDSIDWQAGRKVYVIADMLELGDTSHCAHSRIGEQLAKSTAQRVFLFGREIEAAAEKMADSGMEFFHTNDINELSAALDRYVKTGDIVLLKGSRGLALERLTPMLTGDNNV